MGKYYYTGTYKEGELKAIFRGENAARTLLAAWDSAVDLWRATKSDDCCADFLSDAELEMYVTGSAPYIINIEGVK